MKPVNFLDLFSGIGGFGLAARRCRIPIANHFFSETDEFASRIYSRRFPGAIALGDVRAIDGAALRRKHGNRWIVTGGFPCQDLSAAGLQAGIEGSRSGLWRELLRLINEVQPALAIIENVQALQNNGLKKLLRALHECGFDAEWRIISAASVGAPHRRNRIWIAAYPSSARRAASAKFSSQRRNMGDNGQNNGEIDRNVAWTDWETILAKSNKILPRARIAGSDDGISSRLDIARTRRDLQRVKSLGNSIVPQVAAQIFRRSRFLLE